MQINQSSQFLRVFADGKPRILLDPEDLYVYIRKLSFRGSADTHQTAGNVLPGVDLIPGYASTPTYRVRSHAEWDHHDAANASRWGINIAEGYRLGNHQTIYQTLRNLGLYGYNGGNGEGVANTPGAYTSSLPPDTFGATTVLNYDNGQMAVFLLNQMSIVKQRTYQFGKAHRWVFLGPQRVIGQFGLVNVVQLTSFQRLGAGSATTAEMAAEIAKRFEGDVIEWCYDDTLIGQGAGGSDLIILMLTEVDQPNEAMWDTNEFSKLEPNLRGCSFMYADMPAPREITVPLALGAVDTLYEIRVTPGWVLRPEALQLISMVY
jgi:hypothetical protein